MVLCVCIQPPPPAASMTEIICVVCVVGWWLNWLEHRLIHQKVAGSNPGQGAYKRQPIDVSLSHLSFSLSLSLSHTHTHIHTQRQVYHNRQLWSCSNFRVWNTLSQPQEMAASPVRGYWGPAVGQLSQGCHRRTQANNQCKS